MNPAAKLCPFQSQSHSEVVPGAVRGVLCGQHCALFVVTQDAAGKPTGGNCALALSAVALIHLEMNAANVAGSVLGQHTGTPN